MKQDSRMYVIAGVALVGGMLIVLWVFTLQWNLSRIRATTPEDKTWTNLRSDMADARAEFTRSAGQFKKGYTMLRALRKQAESYE